MQHAMTICILEYVAFFISPKMGKIPGWKVYAKDMIGMLKKMSGDAFAKTTLLLRIPLSANVSMP